MRDAEWGMRKTVPCFPLPSFQTMHTECSEIIAIREKVVRYAGYVKAKEARESEPPPYNSKRHRKTETKQA